jgi:hypothetical protein
MGFLRSAVHKILQLTHGRATLFWIAFFISGNVLAWLNRLSPVYVAYMGTLGGLILGHSFKDDLSEKWNGPRPEGGPDPPNPPAYAPDGGPLANPNPPAS